MPPLRSNIDQRLSAKLPRPVYLFARRRYYDARGFARRNRGRGRILPDFIVIGAAKSGTTTLYASLIGHPLVKPCATEAAHFGGTKEVHYFDYNFWRGTDWYRAHFPLEQERIAFEREHERPFLTGEATPSYISNHWAPSRIRALLPNVALIAVLRNPVDRAYSQFQMSRREGLEELDFEDAISCEDERLECELVRIRADPLYNSWDFGRWSYLARSRYAEQLERWLEIFPRKQFLFLKSEDLSANPSRAVALAYDFLDLPPHRKDEVIRLHTGEYTDMPPDLRRRLTDYFRPYNERLYELIGMDFGWERESRADVSVGGPLSA